MTLSPKKLLIPRKGNKKASAPVTSGDNDTNMRAIEQYVNTPGNVGSIVKITSEGGTISVTDPTGPVVNIEAESGSTYASLTGPGETTSPGALTQLGEFTVDGELIVHGGAISINNTDVTAVINIESADFITITSTSSFGNALIIEATNGGLVLSGVGASLSGGPGGAGVFAAGGQVELDGDSVLILSTNASRKLGFFGVNPVSQQSHAGITTVAQIVAVLQQYGLLL